jgi:arginase family enzyme
MAKDQYMFLAHTSPPRWPAIKPGRFAATIHVNSPVGCQLALLGLPDDTGIRLNDGRPGAVEGPNAFRAALASFGTTWDTLHAQPIDIEVFDAGDIEPAEGDHETALSETHDRVEATVRELHAVGLIPICIGGGHDLSLPAITALSKHIGSPVGGINFDAHLDVRTRAGSGMAFRRLIEGGFLDPKHFVEIGLSRFANDHPDVKWLTAQRLWDHTFTGTAGGFLSLDLDGIDSAEAPGVSALNPLGLHVQHAAALAEAAGAHSSIRHFDLMELSPPHDPSGRTARVAALLFLTFVAGFGARPQ